jgi:N6-adenosine-specific RNA methylase IME4
VNYPVILADPPWHFQNWAGDEPNQLIKRGHGAQRHYPTMPTEDIARLVVPAADNAVLFLWACWPMLTDALRVIEGWGFEYKTLAWVWAKMNPSGFGYYMGMGYYTRSNSEPCLFATRGSLPKPAARDVLSLIAAPVRRHSQKPDEQYGKIERLYPNGPYLEMFARCVRPGWNVWGNEVTSDIEIAQV